MSGAFAIQPEQGRPIVLPIGDPMTILAGGAETGAAMSVMTFEVSPLNGPPVHTHSREDELWFVLNGEFRFKAGDNMLYATTGGMAYGPRGLAHAFQNIGTVAGGLLVVTAPAGLEHFFQDWQSNRVDPRDEVAFSEFGAAYGLQFVGPPLSISDPI